MDQENTKSPFEGIFKDKPTIAKKRYRVIAFMVDMFIFWLLGMVLGIFFGEQIEGEFGYSLNGLPALILVFFGFFLWPISEGLFGQTIGKRSFDLKVVKDNYEPIDMKQAWGRFFLGFIDYIFLIGIIIAATNKQNKRIGDMVAKTIVIKSNYKGKQNYIH